jgi:hypothetical protein
MIIYRLIICVRKGEQPLDLDPGTGSGRGGDVDHQGAAGGRGWWIVCPGDG